MRHIATVGMVCLILLTGCATTSTPTAELATPTLPPDLHVRFLPAPPE